MRKKHTHYHKDGSIWAKGFMNAGKMDGPWTWFRKDGSKMRSGSFKLGEQTDEWITYDKHSKPVKKTMMKEKYKICSRGHRYKGPGPCPICWPGSRTSRRAKGAVGKHR